ncbi:transcriptional regulator, HxlR family [Dyadobacter sp. SG02]|uniref:winged helix-turn-helix transcriptional regulator n=1 Tax=Dyadobacter sp. SG02 TaxID=1855291 RepID=UPI0008C087AF|nr:helix-turn-helix domain-containing protein [Dyadobacter sp. SG02]SEI53826.1 transcriptional regulator, HxlR family [Dyadobacter sp. SG02]
MAYNRTSQQDWATDPGTCSIELALASISGKWILRIYGILRDRETVRYCDLNNQLTDISEKTLTAQLRKMEQDGIVTRVVYPEVPPRVEYQLTPLGQSLETIYDALMNWGERYAESKKEQEV